MAANTCLNIQKSLGWCQGTPELPGIMRRLYYIAKSSIVKWPTLKRDTNGLRCISAVLEGDFELAADETWRYIDILPDKSQLTSEAQGELPSQTQQNKIEANACLLLPPADNGKPNIGVAGAFAGMVNGKLYVAGGANFPGGFPWTGAEKVWHRTLYVYDFDKAQWSQYPDFLPEPAAYGVSVTTPDGIIVIGGSNAGGNRADVRLITEREGKPAIINDALPQLPFPWSNGAGALVDGKIYIAGGIKGNGFEEASHTFLMLDLSDTAKGWQQLQPWQGAPVGFSVAAACGGKFYLFGGRDFGPDRPTEIKPCGYAYDTVSGAWQQLPGEFPVMAGSAATVGNEIWIFGGVEEILPTDPSHPGFPKKIRRYNPAANTLEAVGETTVPVAVTTTAVKRTDRDIILASGEERPGVRTPLLLQIHVR